MATTMRTGPIQLTGDVRGVLHRGETSPSLDSLPPEYGKKAGVRGATVFVSEFNLGLALFAATMLRLRPGT